MIDLYNLNFVLVNNMGEFLHIMKKTRTFFCSRFNMYVLFKSLDLNILRPFWILVLPFSTPNKKIVIAITKDKREHLSFKGGSCLSLHIASRDKSN